MARKNPLAGLMTREAPSAQPPVLDYAVKGASRSMISSLDEIAARADILLDGKAVVDLEPAQIDPSFISDRLDDDGTEFEELKSAIRERGQDSPILVRPHPKQSGRYMIVFGHRRWRVAAELGRKVRSVVQELTDRDHVVAQGQENSARANLSFLERARFAAKLVALNYDNDNSTVLAALSCDGATLSKMLSVANLPAEILDAIGPARSIGRNRWYELKLLLDRLSNREAALEFLKRADMQDQESDIRFERLVAFLQKSGEGKRPRKSPEKRDWMTGDGAVAAEISAKGKSFNLVLKTLHQEAKGFGEFLERNLDRYYQTFREEANSSKNQA